MTAELEDEATTSMPKPLVRLGAAALLLLGPLFLAAIDYLLLLVGYRLLLLMAPELFDGANRAAVSEWAWQIGLWRLPLHLIILLLYSGRNLWRSMRTGLETEPAEKTGLTRFAFKAIEPITVFAVAVVVLDAHVSDRQQLYTLAAVSVLLVTWPSLLAILFKRVLRPIGRAWARAADDGMAEVRTCKTGYHHRWCGHLENPD
ncbi:hypothetical protein Rhe02_27510 [Rhizocola hellebori]|uniref:Uncharacterized protein n=1 Tax=Rhizocola hellebori TaxID=1392758 RepID=A0A8J3Q778_9ACTN|nr:hypothetical protein [Rhizocola hellebori]GIH04684.1 hypothetical protein Rhe02_27510 [Rhizocola hellebori]